MYYGIKYAFNNDNNINNDLFNDILSNLKLLLKSNTNNFFIEDFDLYEKILFKIHFLII